LRQHDSSILSAFALAHNDGAESKIHVFHTKLQALVDSHPRAIQQLGKQAMLTLQHTENAGNLIGRQHDGEVCFRAGAPNLLHPWQIDTEHFAEKTRPKVLACALTPPPYVYWQARTKMPRPQRRPWQPDAEGHGTG